MELGEYYRLQKVVTLDVYDNMTHSIGFDSSKVKRGKYKAYRNGYITNDRPEDIEIFDAVIKNELMKSYSCADNSVCFIVTQKGIDFIAFRENCRISEME